MAKGSEKSEISIVIPAFNECESIPELLEEIDAAMHGFDYRVIVVDDGSSDKTWRLLADLAEKYPLDALRFSANRGKAAALAAGFAESRGDFVATLDADLQDDPAEIPEMIRYMRSEGYDLVSGWKKDRKDPAGKKLPSRVFNFFVRLTTGLRLHDFNCGLKVYRKCVVKNMELYGEMHRYTPVLAAQQGFRVGEKVVHHRTRKYGQTKYGMARFFRGFSDLLTVLFLNRYSYRPLHFFGGIGTALALAGLGISIYLTVLWFGGSAISNRPLLLLGVLLLVVGIQFISLGLLGEMVLKLSRRKSFSITERIPFDPETE
ncbi:MAG: glycosyltransferase [Candidatus Aegiribacteria sp.]|nr:glycosyltransferase [Candidatus Aegiribacteria sp.]MBD3295366.1 glycosyltransferase [Candidatus Fermentibacteria bacterium]